MGRIRTIKPELPQSESLGRCSRDARLLFILLFTLADDSGRLRGNSRMLASLLFPYDDDAPKKISGWLDELVREHCIAVYSVEGNAYVELRNWLQHQKIDKPTASKIPPFANAREDSPNSREDSSLDQGSRTKDQGEDQGPPPTPKGESDNDKESEFVKAWNDTPGTTRIERLKKGKRLSSLQARLKESDWRWKQALAKFPLKCFAGDGGFVPHLEWFTRPDTVDSIIEGKYDWQKTQPKPKWELLTGDDAL